MSTATASSADTKPVGSEEEASTFRRTKVLTQASETRLHLPSFRHDEEDSSDDKGLVDLDVGTTSAAITTAEKLKEAVDADVSPSDPLMREHFGFINVNTIGEETNLLGL
ncbi:MAG: hypothetical protein Q9161_000530 [Pseudevernia consocians]